MSIESDFRATLAAYAPLTALVGTRISQNAVSPGSTSPCVVFSAAHSIDSALDGTRLGDQCSLQVQCWAETAVAADAVADAVVAALATGLAAVAGAVIVDRASAYDEELGLDATVLSVEWWEA